MHPERENHSRRRLRQRLVAQRILGNLVLWFVGSGKGAGGKGGKEGDRARESEWSFQFASPGVWNS